MAPLKRAFRAVDQNLFYVSGNKIHFKTSSFMLIYTTNSKKGINRLSWI